MAMAYVWQQGIDAGDAQPVTDCPAGEQFPVPDAPWPGLGLADDSECWGVLWSRLDDEIEGLVGKAMRRERERVRYDVYGKVAKALNERIGELFDSDGEWRPDDTKVKLRGVTEIVAHQPTFFTELVAKVDRNAPPDFRLATPVGGVTPFGSDFGACGQGLREAGAGAGVPHAASSGRPCRMRVPLWGDACARPR